VPKEIGWLGSATCLIAPPTAAWKVGVVVVRQRCYCILRERHILHKAV
jgi:hypothetical protein